MIKIGIVGAGPSGLFVYKRLIETGNTNFQIELFEKKDVLGCGIPYGKEGALPEHITNVSGNEIPELPVGLTDWIKKQSPEMLQHYNINQKDFDAYNVLPRLLFGKYLEDQFNVLQMQARQNNFVFTVHKNLKVIDIKDLPDEELVKVKTENDACFLFDIVIICTGHFWPSPHKDRIGYFDSSYPPSILNTKTGYPIGIKGIYGSSVARGSKQIAWCGLCLL